MYEDEASIHLVLDYTGGGELFGRILKRGKFSEETASKFVFVGGDFLPLLRDKGVAYADIPPWILTLHTGEQITW